MKSGRALKNEFLFEIHDYERRFKQILLDWYAGDAPNLSKMLLNITLDMEDKYENYGEETFYQTLTGALWTKFCVLLSQEYVEIFDVAANQTGFLKNVKVFYGMMNAFGNYLRVCDGLTKDSVLDQKKLMAGLVSEYIILYPEISEEVMEEIYNQVTLEFTILEDKEFALDTIKLCKEMVEDATLQEKTLVK